MALTAANGARLDPTSLPPVLTTEEAADLLACSRTTLWAVWRDHGGLIDAYGNVIVKPVIVGRRALRWPTAPLLRLIGLDGSGAADGHPAE